MIALFTENRIDQVKAMLDKSVTPGSSLSDSIIHSDKEFSLVYVQLPPSFQSGVFDHATYCVTMTLQGCEGNTFYQEQSDGSLKHIREQDIATGETLVFPPDCIRSVENKSADSTTKVLMCFVGDIREINKQRHVYDWVKHTKLPYSFNAVLEHGVARMDAHKNEAGIRALKGEIAAGHLAPKLDAVIQ